MAFEHSHRVRFQECDVAGIVYFAHVFTLCHEAYEDLLRQGGLPFEETVTGGTIFPLRHAEADYTAPLRLGMLVRIRVVVAKLGERSFTLRYALSDEAGTPLATALTVHVAVEKATMKSTSLPARQREVLEQHVEASESSPVGLRG